MFPKKQIHRSFVIYILVLSLLAIEFLFALNRPVAVIAAQSTGDILPTRTPTATRRPSITPTPTSTVTTARKVWIARLVSNTLGATEGHGSIFRVSVDGVKGIPIELRSDDQLITANSGSKPEYGPFAAEFAPVTEGTWTVTVPTLNVSINVFADNYNLAVIEFVQIDEPQATQTALPTVTSTPLGATDWAGQLVSETKGSGVPFSRLLVQVAGRNGQAVQLSTVAQVINMAHTGQKPEELGPNTVEFTGLTPGRYIIEPLGLNAAIGVDLKPNIETRVEFRPVLPAPTPTYTPTPTQRYSVPSPTFTPIPPTLTPTPTVTPTPTETATPTTIPSPTLTPTPLASPTPVTRWLGTIEARTNSKNGASSLVVRIAGIEGLPVGLIPVGSNTSQDRRCITGRSGIGQDMCIFDSLTPGQYIVTPEGLGLKLPITLFENESVEVNFGLEVLPSGITGWHARINNNSNGSQAIAQFEATIRVRVAGRPGQVVALRPARIPGAVKYCEVVHNPVLGGLICEFGQLGPGVYTVEALNTGADFNIFVDGAGIAEVEFSPSATYAALASTQTSPLVGQGARPDRPTTTATATATSVPLVMIQPTPTSTAFPTPTPAFAWQGRIVESDYTGAGAIGVRAAGLKDHPVIIRSGGWQSPPLLTGSKVELGEYAVEFGGLAPGEYILELVDLAELKVTLQPGEFMLVEFRYDFVNPP